MRSRVATAEGERRAHKSGLVGSGEATTGLRTVAARLCVAGSAGQAQGTEGAHDRGGSGLRNEGNGNERRKETFL